MQLLQKYHFLRKKLNKDSGTLLFGVGVAVEMFCCDITVDLDIFWFWEIIWSESAAWRITICCSHFGHTVSKPAQSSSAFNFALHAGHLNLNAIYSLIDCGVRLSFRRRRQKETCPAEKCPGAYHSPQKSNSYRTRLHSIRIQTCLAGLSFAGVGRSVVVSGQRLCQVCRLSNQFKYILRIGYWLP